MICKKCGQEIPDGSRFCFSCGHAFSGKTKAKRIIIAALCVIIALLLPVFALFCGIHIGKTSTDISDRTPEIAKIAAERLKEVTEIPIEIEVTQSELNAMIKQYEEKMLPVKNVVVSLPESGGAVIEGKVEKSGLSNLFGTELPSLIMLLLPDDIDISITANPDVKEGIITACISSVSAAGLSLGKETLDYMGADDIIADIVNSSIEEQYGEKIKIDSISIINSKSGERAFKVKVRYYIWK